jgi:hypothetical protein
MRLVPDLRGHGPGDQRLERLTAGCRARFGFPEQLDRELNRGAHKSIKARRRRSGQEADKSVISLLTFARATKTHKARLLNAAYRLLAQQTEVADAARQLEDEFALSRRQAYR